MPSRPSRSVGASRTTPLSTSSASSVRWEGGRLRADVRLSRTVVLTVSLALATWLGLPSITSLLVASGVTPSGSSGPTVVVPPAEAPKTCSTSGPTSTGRTDQGLTNPP